MNGHWSETDLAKVEGYKLAISRMKRYWKEWADEMSSDAEDHFKDCIKELEGLPLPLRK